MKSTTEKGIELENYVVSQIKEKGIDFKCKREYGSGRGSHDKADVITGIQVLGQNAGIECKHAAQYSIGPWWAQTKKLQSLNCEPILAFKNINDGFGETKVVIYLDTLLELIKAGRLGAGIQQGDAKAPEDVRDVEFKAKHALAAVKVLLKGLEDLYER